MIFLVVDDERIALRSMERTLRRLYPDAEILCADNYIDALELAKRMPSVAFLDVEMPEMTGTELAGRIRKIQPQIQIIFATAYDDSEIDMHLPYVCGYLTKPYMTSDIQNVMKKLNII